MSPAHWELVGYLVRSGVDAKVFTPQIEGMQEADVCNAGGINAVKRFVRDWLAREGIERVRFVATSSGSYDVEYTKVWG